MKIGWAFKDAVTAQFVLTGLLFVICFPLVDTTSVSFIFF